VKDIHIMLVDDEPSILDLTERHLEKMGYCNITSCLGGQSAMEKYQENNNSFDSLNGKD